MNIPRNRLAFLLPTCLIAAAAGGTLHAANETSPNATSVLRQHCFHCHGKAVATAGLNLEQLAAQPSLGENFQHWRKVVAALEEKRMPPPKMRQPSEAERHAAVAWIRAKLNEYAEKHAGDPGRVTVRRLTSGEYAYAVRDLTDVDIKLEGDFATDSVGGEGFTNFGDVQFMGDANLERYLETAKKVADHAIIGAGSLQFFEHPGKSGLELSAVDRIQKIYRAHGFRNIAGEGAQPYGLDHYGKAFFAAWRYQHRQVLGDGAKTMDEIAAREAVNSRFAQHIWSIIQQKSPTYPISDVIAKWRALPAPDGSDAKQTIAAARAGCQSLQSFVIEWPRWLFAAGPLESKIGDDPVYLLNEESITPKTAQRLRFVARGRAVKVAKLYLTVASVNPVAKETPYVTWRNGAVRVLRGRPGAGAGGGPRQAPAQQTLNDFTMAPGETRALEVPLAEGASGYELSFEVEIPSQSNDAVLRCSVSERPEISKGRTNAVLLGNPRSKGYEAWKAGVLEFAARLPQNSHGEPTPSDRDPIPPPFNPTYNQPERDHYHTKVKYYRTDEFLAENILDNATRAQLDQAWNDLRLSFEYHDTILRFIAGKYKVDLKKSISDLSQPEIDALPAEPRKYVSTLRAEYDGLVKTRNEARQGHIDDAIRLASKAWRRPLSKIEEENLRSFYRKARTGAQLDHDKALRSLLARILVSPAFLYRLEQPSRQSSVKPLTDWELASRLSFFLWSSIPDDELRRAASAGELSNPQKLERQVKRMLADPKARRFSTEFFGQWLGFYRFDQSRIVDTTRFPEFTDEVKAAMYDEAISFFEHIVRNDRPVREIVHADYTFLNKPLAKHYGVKKDINSATQPELVPGSNEFHRGGALRLGAVLAATSAPLRTSPVKRGDWVLRRVLGTATPPPPADAGSIPADDKMFGGLTVFERLEVHKRNPTCASCHVRIDPLGFPLERYDSVGRWRDKYADGKPIHDSGTLADQTPIAGVDGLLAYLKKQEPQVLRTMSNKLLGYALGRTIIASDQPLVERLTKEGGDTTLSKLIAEIAKSKQFRYRRECEETQQTAVRKSTKEGKPL